MFRFKEFTVKQDQTAMKVGTDGVLLGSWAPIEHRPYSILDIGTGTGLIALMLAQRSFAEQIDGLEIEDNAYEQAVENFEESPWNDRLFCYHASLKDFAAEIEDRYDLILCNPPFFKSNQQIEDKARETARFYDGLPFDELIVGAKTLLSEIGVFAVIIPFEEQEHFIALAEKALLFPFKITQVKGNPTAKLKRSLLAFSAQKTDVHSDCLTIESDRHQYSPEFTQLVKDFYLKL